MFVRVILPPAKEHISNADHSGSHYFVSIICANCIIDADEVTSSSVDRISWHLWRRRKICIVSSYVCCCTHRLTSRWIYVKVKCFIFLLLLKLHVESIDNRKTTELVIRKTPDIASELCRNASVHDWRNFQRTDTRPVDHNNPRTFTMFP